MPIIPYKYIYFIQVDSKPATAVFECRNTKSNAKLGTVKWYNHWRQYCFFPETEVVFSSGCLDDISEFIQDLKLNKKGKGTTGYI